MLTRVLFLALEEQHQVLLRQTFLALRHLRCIASKSGASSHAAQDGPSVATSRSYGSSSSAEEAWDDGDAQPDTERRFVDRIRVNVMAGNGGAGCTSYHRGRLHRKGIADGGNGGRGGDVIFVASGKVYDLGGITTSVRAEKGGAGTSKNQVGSRGQDRVVQVPVGTVVRQFQGRERGADGLASVAELAEGHWTDWEGVGNAGVGARMGAADGAGGDMGGDSQGNQNGSRALCEGEEPDEARSSVQSEGELEPGAHGDDGLTGEGSKGQSLDDEIDLHREEELGEEQRQDHGHSEGDHQNPDATSSEDLWPASPSRRSTSPVKGPIIADLTTDGQRLIAAVGGCGGKGNASSGRKGDKPWFKRKPGQLQINEHETGEHGQQQWLELELKVLADVGLVGMPNAGKSTLLAALSPARPAVGSYAFTTLRPHIGTVECDAWYAYTVADIPGLIEGAHANRGLGHKFLRHVERTRVLAYVLDMAGGKIKAVGPAGANKPNPKRPWEQLEDLVNELEHYEEGLSQRPSIVVANKMDEPGAAEALEELRAHTRLPVYPTCAVLKEGTEELKGVLEDIVTRFNGGG